MSYVSYYERLSSWDDYAEKVAPGRFPGETFEGYWHRLSVLYARFESAAWQMTDEGWRGFIANAAVQGPFGANWFPAVVPANPSQPTQIATPSVPQPKTSQAWLDLLKAQELERRYPPNTPAEEVLELDLSEVSGCTAKPSCGLPDWRCTRCHKDNCPSAEKCWYCAEKA